MADLILAGHRAYLSDQGLPYDVVVDVDGELHRIQVKSTRGMRPVPQRAAFTPGYLFFVRRSGKGGRRLYADNAFDLVAFVALDIRVIAYMPFDKGLKGTLILRPPGAQITRSTRRMQNIDQFPIADALEDLRDGRIAKKRLKSKLVDGATLEKRLANLEKPKGKS